MYNVFWVNTGRLVLALIFFMSTRLYVGITLCRASSQLRAHAYRSNTTPIAMSTNMIRM